MPARLEMLRSLVAQGAADPFAHYGLAMELRTQGQLHEAWQIFEALLDGHPDYIAAYAPAADTLIGLLRNQEAREISCARESSSASARGKRTPATSCRPPWPRSGSVA